MTILREGNQRWTQIRLEDYLGRWTWVVMLVVVVAASAVLWGTARWTERAVLEEMRLDSHHRLSIYHAYLRSELGKRSLMPWLASLDPMIGELIDQPDDPARVAVTNRRLDKVNQIVGGAVTYLMDADGLTLAASNWQSEKSFIGRNYGFRPYFREALAGRTGRYVAVGVTSGKAGFYVSHPVSRNGDTTGVVVVKFPLEQLEPTLAQGGDRVMLADANGVVFLSNTPTLRLRTLAPLSDRRREAIEESRQYPLEQLTPLSDDGERRVNGIRLLHLDDREWLVAEQRLPELGWRLIALHAVEGLERRQLAGIAATTLVMALAATLLLYWLQRRRYLHHIYDTAIRDPLTRLYTRLYMHEAVETLLENHNRDPAKALGLVSFDLDHFKSINDRHGHHVGDLVLTAVSRVILDEVRSTDIPVRLGGEELSIFLPAPGAEQAQVLAERIRVRVEALTFPEARASMRADELRVTISGGVVMHRPQESLSDLLVRADTLLYAAKNAGRNRVHIEETP